MKRTHRVSIKKSTLIVVLAVLGTAGVCLAGDYDQDFTLRFPAAMSRFATYGDVAAVGGASAGSKWSSSVNPASLTWLDANNTVCASQQYSRLWFGNGTGMNAPAESVTVNTGKYGSFIVGAAQINTNRRDIGDGLDFEFTGDMDEVGWAKKISDDWAFGGAFSYTKSVTNDRYFGTDYVKGNSDSYVIRGGALHRIVDKWLGGLVLDYGWSSDRTAIYTDPEMHLRDSTRQFLVRPGVSFEYMKDCTYYLDYQFGTFWNDTGTMNVHRIYTGVDHALTDWLFLRAGTAIDPGVMNCAWTCGIGFYPTKWLSLDVGYQYDMFPEIHQEFGRSHTLNASLSFSF